LAFAPVAQAEPLSRADAIELAVRQNPQVAAARAQEAGARAIAKRADAARLPAITLDLGIGPSLKAELVPGTAVMSTESQFNDLSFDDLSVVFGGNLRIVQPLYTFGKIDRRRRAARHGVRAREAQTEMTRADVALEVATLYESYLFASDAALFLEEIEHSLDRSIQATQERLDAGKPDVSEQDLIRLQTSRSSGRMGLNRARAGMEQARAGLKAYLGLDDDAELELSESSLEAIDHGTGPATSLIDLAKSKRPELRALAEGADAYDDLAEADRAGHKPDFFVLGYVSGAYTPGRDLIETRFLVDPVNHFAPGLLVGLRWRIPGIGDGSSADEHEAAAERLRKLREWAVGALPAEVRKAYEDAERARKDIEESAGAVNRAKQWMVRASADYAVGLADSRDLDDAVRAYVGMRLAYMDGKHRHNIAMAELAKATGTLVSGESDIYP
jgi:outer membrane protein TolC